MLEMRVRQLSCDAVDNPVFVDMAVEAVQRWIEYLDELELSDFHICTDVTAKTEGKAIKFSSIDKVAEWITSSK